ncbi:hypothetical protein FJY68_09895 [candidate division WOR-3 bacterium]|uniref:HTH HARE-type domain-containing protein n=1 Tax=candidate division WOR-3 bacterium TaxID=2052148 RepID=A0A937XIT5_UNCW3|nr:hypothetical protein [candidate division WOR-3 bacterium]
MTIKEAATRVLGENRAPMRTRVIWAAISRAGYYKGSGRTPYRTLTAVLYTDIRRYGSKSTFVRRGFGLYGLRGQKHDD